MIEFFLILQLISSILGQDFCSYPVMNYSEIDVFNLGDRIILKSHIIGSESKYWNYNYSSGLLDKSPLEVKDFIENGIISVNIVSTFVLKFIVHFQRTHKSFQLIVESLLDFLYVQILLHIVVLLTNRKI